MKCYVNGELLSSGNTKNMNWTFEQIIERASYGAKLYPGDVIGSGTVGTGCLLELNGTRKLENAKHKDVWLKEGDIVSLKIDGLGETSNKIIAKSTKYMIN
jgi:fumarylacetoacetate (FAA) hydrolase